MVESRALRLAVALMGAERALLDHLAAALGARGHADVTPSALGFLAQLDCGVNSAAEIARRIGVSRQMVSKTVREMAEAGFLSLAPDPEKGNRKQILFTARGRQLMADARRALADLDGHLGRADTPAAERLETLIARLETLAAEIAAAPARGPEDTGGAGLPDGKGGDIGPGT